MFDRYLKPPLEEQLSSLRQMVFLNGPRQVGKTTLSQSLLSKVLAGKNYFNWDVQSHRKALLSEVFIGKQDLSREKRICFDEIHKYARWKNALKGLFDLNEPQTHWIVTGSALLNTYRRGQDSLVGRVLSYHLFPFSVAEVTGKRKGELPEPIELGRTLNEIPKSEAEATLNTLDRLSGFPEPFFKQEEAFLRRWRSSRLDRLVNEDLAKTENLNKLSLVEQLMFLLPSRVGSLFSTNSVREDLEVHFTTVKRWIELLERVFYGFRVRPYSKKLVRSLKKEPKFYLWDWTEVESQGARFENLVAVHLLKYIYYRNEVLGEQLELRYVRDLEKHEIDFLICERNRPVLGIECKLSSPDSLTSVAYVARKLKIPRTLVLVKNLKDRPRTQIHREAQIEILPAASFLATLV